MSTLSRRGFLTSTAAVALGAAGLSACGASGSGSADTSKPLTIMADATPHTDILKKAQDLGLLGDVKINIKGITGDIDPNQLTEAGDIDASFFEHQPYLDDWSKQKRVDDIVLVCKVHIEPLGLYSKKVKSLAAVPQGATIAIPSDPANQARAFFLFQEAKLLTLGVKPTDKDVDFSQVTEKSITANPKALKFITIDRPQLAASLDDAKVDLSIVNGNYALEAGLTPKTDALVLESAVNNAYANGVAVKKSLVDDPRVKKLSEALTSKQVQDWITSNYQGSVLPAQKA